MSRNDWFDFFAALAAWAVIVAVSVAVALLGTGCAFQHSGDQSRFRCEGWKDDGRYHVSVLVDGKRKGGVDVAAQPNYCRKECFDIERCRR